MATKVELSKNFYLWMPAKPSSVVVISSHGGSSNSKHFPVPKGVTFKFYSYPLTVAKGTLEKTMHDEHKDVTAYNDKWPNRTMEDYYLTKYQGRHGHGETYSEIEKFVGQYNVNVVSVRNRTGFWIKKGENDLYLSTLVRLVEAQLKSNPITEYRCLFCRSPLQRSYVDVMPHLGQAKP